MGHWRVRAVCVLLVAALAGGPAVAAVCDAICADAPQAATLTETNHQQGHDHTAPSRDAAAAVGAGDQAVSGHDHHKSAETAAVAFPESLSRLHLSSGPALCSKQGQPRASLAAARADTRLRPTPQLPLLLSAALLDGVDDREPAALSHAPPPGASSTLRTPLVLRI